MKDFAKRLYKSKQWQACRAAYAASRGHLCEECMAKGIYKTGDIVHHKIPITANNIDDPTITLNWDNLELVCRDCHAREHSDIYAGRDFYHAKRIKKRYRFGENGEVITLQAPQNEIIRQ